jgi:hypothetical protein
MKHMYKIGLVILVSGVILYTMSAMTHNKKNVTKFLDKDKSSCGYHKLNSKVTYYISDGTTIYNTDATSCRKLRNKNTVDNIIVIEGQKKVDTAIVNSIGDDGWYGEVKEDFKQIDKIKY